MGKNDMNHMQHLESVALSDCAVLETKEGTYKGSWKRAGGRSAWFMARRNLDRLITMMSPKEFPEYIKTFENVRDTVAALDVSVHYNFDVVKQSINPLPGSIEATRGILKMLLDSYTSEDIFMKIREKPSGEDGTVLACLRDARRYFMLVEAEMIAEGVVEPETKTYEMDRHNEWDGIEITSAKLEIHGDDIQTISVDDVETFVLAREDGVAKILITRRQSPVHAMKPAHSEPGFGPSPMELHRDMRAGGYAQQQSRRHPVTPKDQGTMWSDRKGAHIRAGDICSWRRPEDGCVFLVELTGTEEGLPVVKGSPAVPDEGRRLDSWNDLLREGTPRKVGDGHGDESIHAKANPLWPWHATKVEFDNLVARVGPIANLFYTRRAPDIFQLESVAVSRECPQEIYKCYALSRENTTKWVLKRENIPSEIVANFPDLQREMNMTEWETSHPDFKFMYAWHADAQKYILEPHYEAWGKEAA